MASPRGDSGSPLIEHVRMQLSLEHAIVSERALMRSAEQRATCAIAIVGDTKQHLADNGAIRKHLAIGTDL